MSAVKKPTPQESVTISPSVRTRDALNDALATKDTAPEDIKIVDTKLKNGLSQLEEEASAILDASENTNVLSIDDALQEGYVRSSGEVRQKTRLLILTRDCTVSHTNGLAQKRILELAEVFSEIHIVVLSEKGECFERTTRLSDNVWLYPTESSAWWRTPFDAFDLAKKQLMFGGGFRVDIIIAEDPFESAAAGHYLSREFDRPFQIHLFEDYLDPAFKKSDEHSGLRLLLAKYFVKRADCVRTKSDYLREKVVAAHPSMSDCIEVFPMYHNLDAWRDAEPSFTLKERYVGPTFFMLSVSAMTERSRTSDVLRSVAPILKRYPNIALVVVGDGPQKETVMKDAITYGLSAQVHFEPTTNDLVSYMKSANLLLHLSEDPEEDYVVFQAAAVGLPIVTGASGVLGELFLDGENAYVCPNDSPTCVTEKINRFLSQNDLRVRFALNAKDMIFERIEQDYGAYLEAYRSSIERCVRRDM